MILSLHVHLREETHEQHIRIGFNITRDVREGFKMVQNIMGQLIELQWTDNLIWQYIEKNKEVFTNKLGTMTQHVAKLDLQEEKSQTQFLKTSTSAFSLKLSLKLS